MASFFATGGSRLTTKPKVAEWGKKTGDYEPTASQSLRRSGTAVMERRTEIPGYTGFIKNGQHVAGRSFGRSTGRALNNDTYKLAVGDQVPSAPQASRKIPICGSDTLTTTLVGKYQSKLRHVPGYTGHVAGTRHAVGETYGNTTSKVLTRPICAKEDRRTLNRESVERFAFPREHLKPEILTTTTGTGGAGPASE